MKKFLSLVMAVAFALSTATVTLASSSTNCEVKSVDGTTVVLDCGNNAGDLKAGSQVKVKAAKKRAIEGC